MQRREELRQKEEALRLQRKSEEKERWWSGAELFVVNNSQGRDEGRNDEEEMLAQESRLREKYSANYSRWEQWIPQVSHLLIPSHTHHSLTLLIGIGPCDTT